MFFFKDEGILISIGFCFGLKLELKVNVFFFSFFVDVWFLKYVKYIISIRCSFEEIFKDLVKKVYVELMDMRERNLEKVIFVIYMDGRIFDLEKDKVFLKGKCLWSVSNNKVFLILGDWLVVVN